MTRQTIDRLFESSALFSLELVCGSSRVHADEWDGTELNHPKHLAVERWADSVGLQCDVSGTMDSGEQFSDAYIRFPASRAAEVAKALRKIRWDGDIVDVWEVVNTESPSPAEMEQVKAVANREGWQLGNGF